MKNLLLIIQKLSDGGAEKAITNLANTLKDNYNVTLITFDYKIKDYKPNVKTINLDIPDTNNLIKKLIHLIKRIVKVKHIKKELDIECSISFLTGPNLVNCLSKYQEKTIISIRNMQSKLRKNPIRDIANKIAIDKADKIIAVAKAVEEDTKKRYKFDKSKISTIPNMVRTEKIKLKQKEKIEEKEFLNNKIKIINIGRLIKQKGQWHLIKAFKIVNEKYQNTELIIMGRGSLKRAYIQLIKKLKLQKNVIILEYAKNPYKYLSKSDIFVSTSMYEGMPNVVLEAMCCGLPIIATDSPGGNKEILVNNDKNYGILIPKLSSKCNIKEKISDEEKNLANNIIELIEDKDKKNMYSILSQKRVNDYSSEIIIKQWVNVIEE